MPATNPTSRQSENMKDRPVSSEAFRSFLARKGDEHIFSVLYFIGGITCLIAAFAHGNNFCTNPISKPSAMAMASIHHLLLSEPSANMKLTGAMAKLGTVKFPAVQAKLSPEGNTGSEVIEGAVADIVSGNATRAEEEISHAPTHAFLGSSGLIVLWLKVEGFTALGLPLVSILMLAMGLNEMCMVSCFLYSVAVFQACWLILGCVWAFGGAVPHECRAGQMGDHVAFDVLWWVCAVWLGTMAIISVLITFLVCFLAGASVLQSPPGRQQSGGYAKLDPAGSQANPHLNGAV